MLHELHIEHLGVIEDVDVVLGPGFTVVTGETGAGKTMLVEAIELLVGGRADTTLVRPGAPEARIEGRFVVGDDELVLARVLPADGRSRAYVNARLATVASLAEHGQELVDLHGQHAHQSLLSAVAQREALDRFAGTDLEPLRRARARLADIDAALAGIGGDARARAREIDLLRFQLEEIAAAAIERADEEEVLADVEELLAGASAHREAAMAALAAIDDEAGVRDTLGTSLAALGHRGPFAAIEQRLRAVDAELADVVGDLRAVAEGLDDDPERLAQVRQRRQSLRDLRRKYGDTLAEVLAYAEATAARVDELESYETRGVALTTQRHAVEAELAAAQEAVATTRRRAAPELGHSVAERLHQLGMTRARLDVVVGARDPGDEVTFLLGANPGEPALPLAKVASGGELARTMLALRLVLTGAPSTLVFDEVDAGIGGSAAVAVGRALADLGRRHQVLVVTHLAQVAALADTHVVVSKSERQGRTVAQARIVQGEDRIEEIARMLSGRADSAAARQHAEELLSAR